MLFDTHAHMDDRAFDGDREALLEALPGSGIGLLVNPGCSLASSEAACALAREYGYIYAAVGSHPDAADEVDEAALEPMETKGRIWALGSPKASWVARSSWPSRVLSGLAS